MTSLPSWSVVIPVKNGGARLKELLISIQDQQGVGKPDKIVAVDSGSTDDSVKILEDFSAEIISIPSEEFKHGPARNLGAGKVSSEVIIFNNQDAVPDNDFSYRNLINDLMQDETCAGICATLLPHRDSDPLTERDVLTEFGLMKRGVPVQESDEKRLEKLKNFHTVCCAVRNAVFREIPFRDVIFGEDYHWMRDVRSGGYFTRVSSARVRHSHNFFPHSINLLRINADTIYFRRNYENYCLLEFIRSFFYGILIDLKYLAAKKNLVLWKKMFWIMISPYARFLQFSGRVLGKYRNKLPQNIVKNAFYYYRQ